MLDDWVTTTALLLVYRDRSKVVYGRNSGNPRFMDAHEDLRYGLIRQTSFCSSKFKKQNKTFVLILIEKCLNTQKIRVCCV